MTGYNEQPTTFKKEIQTNLTLKCCIDHVTYLNLCWILFQRSTNPDIQAA